MIDCVNFQLYSDDSVDKQTKVIFDEGIITNDDIPEENLEISESICSEEALHFGSCEASVLKFRADNLFTPLVGKWLTVTQILNHDEENPLMLGKYKVVSDVPTADRRYRDVTAYDAMQDIINADVTEWYNTILPDEDSAVTMRQFRASFIARFGLEEEELEDGLINDDMIVERTIEPSSLSGKDVITAICEINGCFGHIGRNGKFQYIYLEQAIQGLWPRNDLYPADDLYPRDPKSTRIGKGTYVSCQYEDYLASSIDKLQIRQEENDIGAIVGDGDNCYTIEGNFLVYGKSAAELEEIGERLLGKITGIVYRPFEADCKGNPCFEVGDAVRLVTRYEIVESYILQRTLKGIQALRDDYSAEGVEQYDGNVNSVKNSILQLKGKTNELTRTVEENRLEVKDIEAGLSTEILQTNEMIRLEAQRATTAEGQLSASVQVNADSILNEVRRAQGAEGSLSSSIYQNAQQIALKVDTNGIIQAINLSSEGVSINASKISLEGAITANGKFHINDAGSLYVGGTSAYTYFDEDIVFCRDSLGNYSQFSSTGLLFGTTYLAQKNGDSVNIGTYGNPLAFVYATSLGSNARHISAAYIDSINGGTPVTSDNISNYALPLSGGTLTGNLYLPGNPSSSVDQRIAFLKDQINDIWSDTKNIWVQVYSLISRVSALESAG